MSMIIGRVIKDSRFSTFHRGGRARIARASSFSGNYDPQKHRNGSCLFLARAYYATIATLITTLIASCIVYELERFANKKIAYFTNTRSFYISDRSYILQVFFIFMQRNVILVKLQSSFNSIPVDYHCYHIPL